MNREQVLDRLYHARTLAEMEAAWELWSACLV